MLCREALGWAVHPGKCLKGPIFKGTVNFETETGLFLFLETLVSKHPLLLWVA